MEETKSRKKLTDQKAHSHGYAGHQECGWGCARKRDSGPTPDTGRESGCMTAGRRSILGFEAGTSGRRDSDLCATVLHGKGDTRTVE